MQNKSTAFTLVELIVVITILAILGTIAFISLQGYSAESRDSKRISDLGQIRTGLSIEQAREGIVPMPSEAISIGSGTTIYTYQGYAGTGVLNSLRVSDNAKDPVENNYYTYTTNSNRTRFQLMAMLENGDTVSKNNLITQTYADYASRYSYTIGDPLGTLLQTTTKIPVQELGEDINLLTDTEEYIPVFTRENSITSSSGSELVTRIIEGSNNTGGTGVNENDGETGGNESETPTLTGWRAIDTNCEIEDITIGTQTWAGCNSTLGNGVEWGKKDDGTNGTIGSCYNYNGINDTSDIDCEIGNPDMQSNSSAKTFFEKKQGVGGVNSNGDSEFDAIWGKFYTFSESSTACPEGRSVPTDEDWVYAMNELVDTNCSDTSTKGWQCETEGLGWNGHSSKDEFKNLANALKIPLSGHRRVDGLTFVHRGFNAHLWSSTEVIDINEAYYRYMYWNEQGVNRLSYNSDRGYSVRCIKD